ncbi:hypothetical protein ACS8FD_12470 [Psychrobacter sp. 1U2]|uniref:hypothetical protein n=1 Tax=Psychrobacter sp. 1U2 TaxID=3453577 RepID=UPI003F4540FA
MYFDTQYDAFALIDDSDEALSKTLDVLLFKSSTSSKFNSVSDRLDGFWSSKFIDNLTLQQTNSENFILALSQYIRSASVDKAVVLHLLRLNQESVIKAVRQSGVIAQPDHHSWIILQDIANQSSLLKLDDFLQTAAYIQSQYQERLNAYQLLKNKLQLDQVTAMVFSSLYACEHLILNFKSIDNLYTTIPYQCDIVSLL